MRLAQIRLGGETKLLLDDPRGGIVLDMTMKDAIERGVTVPDAPVFLEGEAEFLPAVTAPEKIVCVGTNYRKHLIECGAPFPKAPVLFNKFPNALSAHNATVAIPRASSQIDYEAELVIVIGKGGKHIPKSEALSRVFGYTCGNDLSARDLQMLSGQWMIGKTLDGFGPVGPYVTTAEAVNPDNLAIGSRVNGEQRQLANTSDMIFDCATLISYISDVMTLRPGDLIFTGTPHGVMLGYPEDQRVWLKSGDVTEVEIESLGTLVTRFAEE